MHTEAPRRTTHDLVVIGAGIIGLACAWRAAQAGMSVLVLERQEPGAGASGVAAGMLAPVTEADFGEESLLGLNLAGRELWGGFAAELEDITGMSVGYADDGALVVAADRDDAQELRRLHDFQRALGLQASWLAPRACRELEPSLAPGVGGAILAPQDGHVDPRAAGRALVLALQRARGKLVTGAEVDSLSMTGDRVSGVRTVDGRHMSAGTVLVAAGAWSARPGLLSIEGRPLVRPVKGQLLELRVPKGDAPSARRIVRTPRCYIVTRAQSQGAGGTQVVIGATVEEQGFDTTVTADAVFRLLEAAREVLPDVGELELLGARAGLRPATPDNSPAIGRGSREGLLCATGHGRNGVLLAPLTARAIVELLVQGTEPEGLAPFDPARFERAKVA